MPVLKFTNDDDIRIMTFYFKLEVNALVFRVWDSSIIDGDLILMKVFVYSL